VGVCSSLFVLLEELGTHEIVPRKKIVVQTCRNLREYKTNGLEAACRYQGAGFVLWNVSVMSGHVSVWRMSFTNAHGRSGILPTAQHNLIAPDGVLGNTSEIFKAECTL
jgi:hypothetical protein